MTNDKIADLAENDVDRDILKHYAPQMLELIVEAREKGYKKGYAAGGVDEILRTQKAENKLMKYLDKD